MIGQGRSQPPSQMASGKEVSPLGRACRQAYEASRQWREEGWRLHHGVEGARLAVRELMDSIVHGMGPTQAAARSNFIRIAAMCILCAACLDEEPSPEPSNQPLLPGV